MKRITYKEVAGNYVNNKPIMFNGTEYSVTISQVTEGFEVVVYNLTTKQSQNITVSTLAKAKKVAKEQLITWGVVFGSEVRNRVKVVAQAA